MQITRRYFVAGSLATMMALSSCDRHKSAGNETIQTSFFCFDTACSVGGVMSQEQLDRMQARCEAFEELFSRTIETSDVARINTAKGAPVEVSEETADLIERSLSYSRDSNGLFDITIGAVSSLWDFKEGIVPAQEQIADALPHVGYKNVQVEGTLVTLADADARIDLGGIAKGYVADVLLDELAAEGVGSAYVNLGGNVKVLGAKEDGTPWMVGVRDPDPDADEGETIARVPLTGGSVVTSGLYERQFELDGRHYWHILDPRTGYPVETEIISASIVSKRSIDGDGLTKPLFMMSVDEGFAFLEEHGVQGLLVTMDGQRRASDGSEFELR